MTHLRNDGRFCNPAHKNKHLKNVCTFGEARITYIRNYLYEFWQSKKRNLTYIIWDSRRKLEGNFIDVEQLQCIFKEYNENHDIASDANIWEDSIFFWSLMMNFTSIVGDVGEQYKSIKAVTFIYLSIPSLDHSSTSQILLDHIRGGFTGRGAFGCLNHPPPPSRP